MTQDQYWEQFWNTNVALSHENPHSQVLRTVHKVPIDEQKWQFHLDEIEKTLTLAPDDTLLDLCAGNGLIAIPFSKKCRSVVAVDFSKKLLEKIHSGRHDSIQVILEDVRKVDLPNLAFSKGLLYGGLQYFSEREVLLIFEKIFASLMPGGVFLVGDVPDIDLFFSFYNKPEWVRACFDAMKSNTTSIGTWFKREILLEMARYVGFGQAKIINQHPGMINSRYRFDLLLIK
ncbi:MAG: class I SAM-dependent methyltransferase [Magnetococcales bacterium]|nr:class I SAM-dependent methyltransferase [Magnetococcales bacterium]MBF0151067.1 class I SAM-dependent methyltransferase [Magnetococcales bacterium]MBF0631595.1 class I SAM-dependent methyltransferase [Magnetococcales bacterium]